ncbi:MAG: fumarylacetoacetate hydrolase family protein [Alphaproteobacteria bacterium]|nr:fumarylacetoacetate hydrolase family protein [Alphaproteobacteria bacterium]
MQIEQLPRLVKLSTEKGLIYAVAQADCYRDLTNRGLITEQNIHTHLEQNTLTQILDAQATQEMDFYDNQVSFSALLCAPEKIFCIGVNYTNRNEEYQDGQETPKNPSVFMRTADSFTGHKQNLIRPPESEQFDYEGEIVIIIGKGGRRIPQAEANKHIAGLTLGNDGTLRDWVRHAKFNVTQGKNFEQSGAIGPALIPSRHFDRFDRLALTTTINGEIRQNDTTEKLLFPFAKLIHYLSIFTRLKPGDIIFTGTPTGAGARFNPPKYLTAGDVIEIASPQIGQLENRVADEKLTG